MIDRPDYFEEVRREAASDWDTFERMPRLAGPWHQLFEQVQSPRHVLSELLQNADDVGATEATVRVDDGEFVFEHNGGDFTPEHFASLCQFGYSNKRSLHTIGFRGIGFKSTFSLGNRVKLLTPSLSVYFERERFTLPFWMDGAFSSDGRTRISVKLDNERNTKEIENNFDDWLKSPASLLFFKTLRSLKIGDHPLRWERIGTGPVESSEWMVINEQDSNPVLVVRSQPEPFPEEALQEIAKVRRMHIEEDTQCPPSTVDIVLGMAGRLFVVLPTELSTALPFACNAPFIQDPARSKIESPNSSFTNRWLLERAGKLAADTMLAWLQQTDLPIAVRAKAYDFFPDVDRQDKSLEGVCAITIEEAFGEAIEGEAFLLTDAGQLSHADKCIVVPGQILDVWSGEDASILFDKAARPPLSCDIKPYNVKKLRNWGYVEELGRDHVLSILQTKCPPKPDTWRQLLALWQYVAPEVTGYLPHVSADSIRICPVQGKEELLAATDIVRLGERRLLQTDEDWDFLSDHLLVLNQNWTRFLAEEHRRSEKREANASSEMIAAAYDVLAKCGLQETSDVSKIIDRVASGFFTSDSTSIHDAVRLSQIAAKLGAKVNSSFRYFTRDGKLACLSQHVLVDEDGSLEELLPPSFADANLLHPAYTRGFTSCQLDDWNRWVSQSSGLYRLPRLRDFRRDFNSRHGFEEQIKSVVARVQLRYPYATGRIYTYQKYLITDFDFPEDVVAHWENNENEASVWKIILHRLLEEKISEWQKKAVVRLEQTNTNGLSIGEVRADSIPARWLRRFFDKDCLPDTRGVLRKPAELLMRTPKTESLIDVEPFIISDLDTERTKPFLRLLGVRDEPTGPHALLDRLRALSLAEKPPIHEVEKWYGRLDQLVSTGSSDIIDLVRTAFKTERLILTQNGTWQRSKGVCISNDESNLPGVEVIRSSVSDLALWQRLEVSSTPTADRLLEWLKELPSGGQLTPGDLRRVESLIARYPERIWYECEHWLNLLNEWIHTRELKYGLSMQSLTPWNHLYPTVKKKTGNFQNLGSEMLSRPAFTDVPSLASSLEYRLNDTSNLPGQSAPSCWTKVFGTEFQRFVDKDTNEVERIRNLATNLSESTWCITNNLEVIPYLDGTPAGTPKRMDVVWYDGVIYISQISRAKLARCVPEEIGKFFGRADIKAALHYSYERSDEDIRAYLEENFELATLDAEKPPQITLTKVPNPTGVPEISDSEPIEEDIPDPLLVPDVQPGDGASDSVPTDLRPGPTHRSKSTSKPNVFERYLRLNRFIGNGDGRFMHVDGRSIIKSTGVFPWERLTPFGDVECFLLAKDVDIRSDSLELPAHIWTLIEGNPDIHSLILVDSDNRPIEISGRLLIAMRDRGEIEIYPASYRLLYKHGA